MKEGTLRTPHTHSYARTHTPPGKIDTDRIENIEGHTDVRPSAHSFN